ncbi:MAG: amidase domain-containing protein [bacterium]
MKRIHFILITFFVCYLMSVTEVLSFSRSDVATYGGNYCGQPNNDSDYNVEDNPNHDPDSYYKNYNSVGGDCANFVSQCLIEGGLDLSDGPGVYGERHINNQWVYATIIRCEHLDQHLVNSQYAEYSSISNSGSPPDNLTSGDVIIFGGHNPNDSYEHAVIVVGGSGNSCIVDAHTNHREHIRWNYGFPNYLDNSSFLSYSGCSCNYEYSR